MKRTRKDHKLALSSLKKEVENLIGRKTSTIGNDDKLRQRELQLQQHIQHLENATSTIAAEIDALGQIPEEDRIKANKAKARWEAARNAYAASRAELDSSKRKSENELDAVRAEVASALQKRDRLQTRRAKLTEQHDRLVTKNSEDAENRARMATQIATQDAHRANVESQYIASIETCERQAAELSQKTQAAVQQLQQIETLLAQQKKHQHLQQTAAMSPSFNTLSQATTSEEFFPTQMSADTIAVASSSSSAAAAAATASSNTSMDRSPTTSPLRAFNFPAMFEPYATTPPRTSNGASQPVGNNNAAVVSVASTTRSRLRSSSMLSAVSNFTDDFEPPAPGAGAGAGAGAGVTAIGTRPKSSIIGETPLTAPTMFLNDSAVIAKEQLKSGLGSGKESGPKVQPVGDFQGNDASRDSVMPGDPGRYDAGNGRANASFRHSLANKSW